MDKNRGGANLRGGVRAAVSGREIVRQLLSHAPFTALGALSGIILMVFLTLLRVPAAVSEPLFWTFHPAHVFVSAYVTAAMYRRGSRSIWMLLCVGYVGSVGIATLSDSVIPFLGELLLGLPNSHIHIGFIEKWWLVNPLAIGGIALALAVKSTQLPHSIHVFLSTWASLFHITMTMRRAPLLVDYLAISVFLFLAVWIPCCTSDIVFPLLVNGDASWMRRRRT